MSQNEHDNKLVKTQGEVILPGDDREVLSDPDVYLSNILDEHGFSLKDTVLEMAELMKDTKEKNTVEDRKLRRELIKDAQFIHGSKANKNNINIGIFTHPGADANLKY